MDEFKVKAGEFEGPLDLLLSLIEKRKLFVNDVSLAQVTDDFIEYVKRFEDGATLEYLDKSAQFILVASTLLLIKSRSLLPSISLTEEEEKSIEDLENRLKELEKIRLLSKHVEKLFGKKVIFEKESPKREPVFAPHESQTIENLYSAMKTLLHNLPQKKEKLPEVVVRQVVSLEQMIEKLTDRIQSGLKMTFREFSSEHRAEKVNVIVSFLAMLELVKNGILKVEQQGTFGDIHMETHDLGTPRYF